MVRSRIIGFSLSINTGETGTMVNFWKKAESASEKTPIDCYNEALKMLEDARKELNIRTNEILDIRKEINTKAKEILQLQTEVVNLKQKLNTAEFKIISGTVNGDYLRIIDHQMAKGEPQIGFDHGGRYEDIFVPFPNGVFNSIPKVLVMLNSIDSSRETNARLKIFPIHITMASFSIRVQTWSDSKIYAVGISWMAYTE